MFFPGLARWQADDTNAPFFTFSLPIKLTTLYPLPGFALADLIFYIPLLGVGLVTSNQVALSAALGVTVYWPIGKIFITYCYITFISNTNTLTLETKHH